MFNQVTPYLGGLAAPPKPPLLLFLGETPKPPPDAQPMPQKLQFVYISNRVLALKIFTPVMAIYIILLFFLIFGTYI